MKFKSLEIGQRFRLLVNNSVGGVELIKIAPQICKVARSNEERWISKNTNVSPESCAPSALRVTCWTPISEVAPELLGNLVGALLDHLELSLEQTVDGNGDHVAFNFRKDT